MEQVNVELETINRTKETPFNGWNKINRAKTTYSDGGKIKRAGDEMSLQEYINSNNQDCTIYQVLDTYRGDKRLTVAQLNTMHQTISDELAEIKDLPTALEVMKEAEKSWKKLPLEVRKEFNNSVAEFQRNGMNWANNKIKAYQDEQKAEQLKQQEAIKQNTQTGVVNNG